MASSTPTGAHGTGRNNHETDHAACIEQVRPREGRRRIEPSCGAGAKNGNGTKVQEL